VHPTAATPLPNAIDAPGTGVQLIHHVLALAYIFAQLLNELQVNDESVLDNATQKRLGQVAPLIPNAMRSAGMTAESLERALRTLFPNAAGDPVAVSSLPPTGPDLQNLHNFAAFLQAFNSRYPVQELENAIGTLAEGEHRQQA
jgi:hypothetical protein